MTYPREHHFPPTRIDPKRIALARDRRAGVPPADLQAEARLCAIAVADGDFFGRTAHRCKPRHFYSEAFRQMQDAAAWCTEKKQPLEGVERLRSVVARLTATHRLAQVGGLEGVRDVFARAVWTPRIAIDAETVRELATRRRLIVGSQYAEALLHSGQLSAARVAQFIDRWRHAALADEPEGVFHEIRAEVA